MTCLQSAEWKRGCDVKLQRNEPTTLASCFKMGALLLAVTVAVAIQPAAARDDLDSVMEGFGDGQPEEAASPPQADDVLDGFDEGPSPMVGDEPPVGAQPSFPALDGYLKFGTSFNFAHDAHGAGEADWRDLSRLRSELQLEVGLKPGHRWQAFVSGKGFYDAVYRINGRDNYTEEVLDRYEDELELREAYILASPMAHLDIKAGRQIMVWGKSDNIRVTDILNPLDLREPGLTDIEDLRLPVTMTRIDGYLGRWNITGIALHEIRFNKLPAHGHDFYPGEAPLPPEDLPSDGGSNTEYAVSINGIFSGFDMAFYWAEFFDDIPHLESGKGAEHMLRKHARLNMLGAAGNLVVGDLIFKGEIAVFDGLKFFNMPESAYSRTDVLAGIEYGGFSEAVLSLDAVIRHMNRFDTVLEQSPDGVIEDEFQTVLRLTREFFNDTLKLTFLASTYGLTGKYGAFQRCSAEYELARNVTLTGGVVLYQSGDLPEFQRIGDNDRFYVELRYDF